MPPQRRRACEACHVAKVRCELSLARLNTSAPCQRCRRIGKECAPAAPRRQRNRITQLEAQVRQLSQALESQASALQTPASAESRNYNGDPAGPPDRPDTTPKTDILAFLDANLSLDLQQATCQAYVDEVVPLLPLVPIANAELQFLRQNCPILLLTVLAFPTVGLIPQDVQRKLVEKAMEVLPTSFITNSQRSLELVRALLVASIWFRSYSRAGQAVVYQLIQLAANIAVDIGICGKQQTCAVAYDCEGIDDLTSIDARRTWLSCFVASSAMSAVMRRPDTNSWSIYHDDCLERLVAAFEAQPTDSLLYHIVKGEKLCHSIASRLALLDTSRRHSLSNPTIKNCVSELREEIETWSGQIPTELRKPQLIFWRHAALIYLNEPILHTQTNKATFASPFIPDNVRPEDFAAPVVTVDHITALYTLLDACHAALDIALELEPTVTHYLSPVTYTPRVLYAIFILIKLYVAVTAPGNTYSAVMNKTELRLEQYFERMESFSAALSAIDPTSCHSMLLGAHAWLEQWFLGYKAIIDQYEQRLMQAWQSGTVHLSYNDNLGMDIVSTSPQKGTGQVPRLADKPPFSSTYTTNSQGATNG